MRFFVPTAVNTDQIILHCIVEFFNSKAWGDHRTDLPWNDGLLGAPITHHLACYTHFQKQLLAQ